MNGGTHSPSMHTEAHTDSGWQNPSVGSGAWLSLAHAWTPFAMLWERDLTGGL